MFSPAAFAANLPADANAYISSSPVSAENFLKMTPEDIIAAIGTVFAAQIQAPLLLARKILVYLLMASGVNMLLSGSIKANLQFIISAGFVSLVFPAAATLLSDFSEQAAAWDAYLSGFIPVLCGMAAAGGYPTSALVVSCTFSGISSLLALFMGNILIPLLTAYSAISVAANLWGNAGMLRALHLFCKLLELSVKGVALLFGVFLGAQSLLASGTDSFALKTGKFILANSIPIVGQTAADAFGSVLAGLRVVKGALAFAAMATIFSMFLPIFASCILHLIVFYASAVLADGFGVLGCSGIILSLIRALRLCLSFLSIYFLLVFFSTVYLVLLGG